MHLQKSTFPELSCAPRRKQFYCFFCGAPSNFKMYCPDSSCFILICQHLPKMRVEKTFILEVLGAPLRKQRYCFFVEHPVYSNFKMDSILILVFWFQFATINSKHICKDRLFLNVQVLREGSSFFASSVEYP